MIHEPAFDLNLIRVFKAIYEKRNVSLAATSLFLTQSATSHALSRLRRQLNDPLFIRVSGAMLPTPFADQLAASIVKPLEQLQSQLRMAPEFDPATSQRQFTLYLSDVGQAISLPSLLERVARCAPSVRIHIRSAPTINPQAALASGEVDLLVGYLTAIPEGLFQKLLQTETYVCVTRADHPLFKDGMTLEAFQRTPRAVTDSTGMAHGLLDKFLEKKGLQPAPQLVVPNFLALPFALPSTNFLTIMPRRLAERFVNLMPLAIWPLPFEYPEYDLKMYWHARYHHDAANIWLRQVTVAAMFTALR